MGNEGWLYYRFFHEFIQRHGPARVVDIGTHMAGSAVHLACGNPQGHVYTMDPDPNSKNCVALLPVKNITAFTGTSMALADQIRRFGPFDIAVIDGEHHINHMYPEYVCYRSMVKDGGLIFFDDVNYDQFPSMRIAWDLIPDPKALLPTLHFSGFGVCKVDHSIHALELRAALRQRERRATA
ncbi:MAG: class I SAM-dependent methyltransferase [bacterium]